MLLNDDLIIFNVSNFYFYDFIDLIVNPNIIADD